MLEATAEIGGAFINPDTSVRKAASDDGHEVQYWWTLRHLNKGYYGTIVTARISRQSYLNRVELQNGCLALGHSNLFIPSTLWFKYGFSCKGQC